MIFDSLLGKQALHPSDSSYLITFGLTDCDTAVECEIEINIKVLVVKALTISGLPLGSIIEEGQLFISTDSEVTILSADGKEETFGEMEDSYGNNYATVQLDSLVWIRSNMRDLNQKDSGYPQNLL